MRNSKNAGFSLVELAVTLVVVGLLMAGLTSGAHLIQAAKLNKVISELTGYKTAVENFRLKYNGWPGDLANAASIWGAYAAGPPATGTSNGNGNNIVTGPTTEVVLAWQHLALANFITGSYTGRDAGTPDFVIDTNMPGSVIKSAHYLIEYNTDIFDTKGIFLQLGSNQTVALPWGSALTPADANIIDTKIDGGDGPVTGEIFFIRGDEVSADATKCVTGTFNVDASATALLADNTVSCRLILWLEKR